MNLTELVNSLTGEDGTLSAAELLEEISSLPDENAAQRERWNSEKEEFLLKESFWKADARDADYLAYRYRKDAVFSEDGSLENGADLTARAREELPEFFSRRTVRLNGVRPQEGKSPAAAPESLSGLSYSERAALFAKDPELYRKLREV